MLVVSVYALIGMIIFFTICLCLVYFRNYRRQQRLQQCIILNLSILIYLHNQNVLYKRGVQASMGYAGQWIEFTSKKNFNKSKTMQPISNATFKREIPGLQQAGLYLDQKNLTMFDKSNRNNQLLSLKASQARINLSSALHSRRYSKNPVYSKSFSRPVSGNSSGLDLPSSNMSDTPNRLGIKAS